MPDSDATNFAKANPITFSDPNNPVVAFPATPNVPTPELDLGSVLQIALMAARKQNIETTITDLNTVMKLKSATKLAPLLADANEMAALQRTTALLSFLYADATYGAQAKALVASLPF